MAIKNEYILEFKSKGVKKTKDDVDGLDDSQNKLSQNATKLKAGMAIAGIAVAALGKHAIQTASEFEALRTRLNTMYGSVSQATKAFETFQRVAATTPFAVKSVVEAGASLKAFGMEAEDNIKAVADLAAFMGVDIVDAASAMGRAFAGGAGAADMLRDRGVLNIIKMREGIDDLSKVSLPEFQKMLKEAIEDPSVGIAGATTALSETFEGSYSNMMDSVDRLAAKMGDSLLPSIKGVMNGITDMVNGMIGSEDATESQIATLKREENQIRILTSAIINSNLPQEERIKQIMELQREYPDFLKNIDAEKVSNQQLKDSLVDLNKQTQLKIDHILQEKLLNKTIEEQNQLISNVVDSYENAQNIAIQFGQNATQAFTDISQGEGLGSVIANNREFVDSVREGANWGGSLAGTVEHLAKTAANLYAEYESGNLTIDQYTEKIKALSENEAYRNLTLSDGLQVQKDIQQQQDNFVTSTQELNTLYDQNANKLETIKSKMEAIDGQIATSTDAWGTFKSVVKEIVGDTEDEESGQLGKFSSGLEKVDIGLRTLPESTANSLKGAAKFGAGMKAITKDLFAQDSALRNQVIESMGAIAMASAGSKAEQLKVQKFMIKANVAKGIIDLWTSPAPSGPIEIAKAVAASATLVARGVTQTKTVDEQIASINAQKGKIGQGRTKFAQYGMNEIVDQATPIIAGEAGAELVQITPLEGANVDGPQGGGNIVITGNILSRDFVQGELIDEIREAIRQGYDFR